jgi:hypothetical protein
VAVWAREWGPESAPVSAQALAAAAQALAAEARESAAGARVRVVEARVSEVGAQESEGAREFLAGARGSVPEVQESPRERECPPPGWCQAGERWLPPRYPLVAVQKVELEEVEDGPQAP